MTLDNKKMFSWMNSKLEVKDTQKYGKGVYAIEKLNKNETLAVFGGYIMTLKEELQLPEKIRDYAHQIDDNLVLGINKIEDIQHVDNINHSCNPNAGFKGQIFLVAIRDINIGEEITFDYAMTLSAEDGAPPYKIECLCGQNNCRKFITDQDWKNKMLQKRYEGYFQYYLKKKIDESYV